MAGKSGSGQPGPGRVDWDAEVLSGSGREKKGKEMDSEKNKRTQNEKFLFNLKIPEKPQLLLTITFSYEVRLTRATCLRTRIVVLYNFREGSFLRNLTD